MRTISDYFKALSRYSKRKQRTTSISILPDARRKYSGECAYQEAHAESGKESA